MEFVWEQTSIWMRIEGWLRENHPARGSGLRPGATEEEVGVAEQLLGVRFPADLRFAYLRHNGEEKDSCGLLEERLWLPLLLVLDRYNMLRNCFAPPPTRRSRRAPAKKARSRPAQTETLWLPGWVPISDSGGCDYHCIDASLPGDAGYGRIIDYSHREGRPIVAPTFSAWLLKLVGDLEWGKFEIDGGGYLHRVGE